MLRIGSFSDPDKGKIEYVTVDQLINIKPELFRIEVLIENSTYMVDFQDVLRFKNFNELSERAIDLELEKIASYRFTIITAYSNIIERQKDLTREFSIWYSKQIAHVYEMSSKPNAVPKRYTDKQMQAKILNISSNQDYWNRHHIELERLRKQARMLSGLNEILSQRNETLRSIGRRRTEFKKGKGYEQSI